VVHTREADDWMSQILTEAHNDGPFKLLLHCYTSGAELAKTCAEMGAWFSVSGIATFKAAEEVRSIIKDMPADKIIIETDCPYLAPMPMRGRRNEPAFVPHIYDKLGEIRGWEKDEVRARTHDAFFKLFDRISAS
jgi:TatD DNase family protein